MLLLRNIFGFSFWLNVFIQVLLLQNVFGFSLEEGFNEEKAYVSS